MSYTLSIGQLHILGSDTEGVKEECSCQEARYGCAPPFVYSIPGQVGFRTALHHLIQCRRRSCRDLRSRVLKGMNDKLAWLMDEDSLLGCVHIQPTLYGAQRLIMRRRDFSAVAHHLASCPRESCAQLRRALLLTIRENIRDQHEKI